MKNKITAIVLSLLLPCMSASALTLDSVKVDTKSETVTVKGTAESGELIVFSVIDKELSGDFLDKLSYQNNTTADENGKFNFEFKMSDAGFYNIITATASESVNKDFVFTEKDSATDLRNSINGMSQSEIETLLKVSRYEAGLYIDGFPEPDYVALSILVNDNKPYNENDIGDFIQKMKQFYVMSENEKGAISNIYDFCEEIGFEKPVFEEVPFKESHKAYATNFIKSKSYKTPEKFMNAVYEAAALAVINNPDGYGNVEKILKAFEKEIEIDANKITDTVLRKLQGSKAKNFVELKTEIEALLKETPTSGGGSSGGGGGGGSSSGDNGRYPIGNPDEIEILENKPVSGKNNFSDLAGYNWAEESINALFERGVVSGKESGKFCPGDKVSRSEFVKLIVLAFGIPAGEKELAFADTNPSSWDYDYIKAAYNAGIVTGMTEGYFGAKEQITRQDMAVILMRVMNIETGNDNIKFADDSMISPYAYNAVYALRKWGILNGDENNNFNPQQSASRAEAAKVIYSAVK